MRPTLLSATIFTSLVMLNACAKHPEEIPAQYTSPMQYQSYSCKQLEQEMRILSRRVSNVGGQVESDASSDDTEMGVGLVLFWPTLFFLDGDTPQAAEYARLKGEFEALEEASVQKNCQFHVEQPVIKKPETRPADQPAFPDSGKRP